MTSEKGIPRIEYLQVKNYRALHDLELKNITPLTVFLGPNGSGKSTIFDVFAFLSECFTVGLRTAWDKRGRFKELRTRGAEGPIEIELKYREHSNMPLITYHLSIDEKNNKPYIAEEWLQWRRGQRGKPFRFLEFKNGAGMVVTGEYPDKEDRRIEQRLSTSDVLAVNTLGQFADHPRVNALRRFIAGWYLSYLTADSTRGVPEAGPQERLSATGDNLPNVIQYLSEEHPKELRKILNKLIQRVPRLETVDAQFLADGRLLLRIKDQPFDEPILAKYASDGTLKLLSYLIVLFDPAPPELIGIEEPENHLHPRLLPYLAEECRIAAENTQLMVTTHSPFYVNALNPNELWILYRDKKGFTQAVRSSEIPGIKELVDEGGALGYLWMEGHFGVGDPLVKSGEPTRQLKLDLK
jgi:predicted ATPase